MAEIVANIITQHPKLEGLWHVSSDPINKYELLKIVNKVYKLGIHIEPDEHFKCDRRLDSTKFRRATLFKPKPWEEMIQSMHDDHTPYPLSLCPA
jgi:dTDP-4-dehydrorhamnose reductase